ncbi:MAG: nuclear transport factor 2 family protein, partial [Chromatiales bacterium]|nr:nuclear transport factor 2 family protein [Chromatiales bacterium]
MKGFDTKWPSLPDYILGVTREIWEERNIASIENYFVEDVPVRSPDSIGFGTPNIFNDTMAKLAAFPDQQLLGEDVIWSGSAEVGFLASHRILNTATHGSDGVYGAASGTRLVYRSIVESAARDNQIYDQ